MSQDMLGTIVDIVTKLHNGSISHEEAKRFARRENPFEPKVVGTFNPTAFIGKGWEVIGERKVLPEGWNSKQLAGISALKSKESYINGHEWMKRLADKPLLGVEAFWVCWNNQQDIPEELKPKTIFLDGDDLRDPFGSRFSLCLRWLGGRWHWDCYWLGHHRRGCCVSAVPAR